MVIILGSNFCYAVKLAYYRKPKEACQYFDLGDSSQTYRINLASGFILPVSNKRGDSKYKLLPLMIFTPFVKPICTIKMPKGFPVMENP
ncbi:MAG: hypothetical protein HW384_546 [Dehalococcoidia bacterium]|nr:hypothetical protein [Dehalococcoidia bacterium]MBF8304050.1 hypothetical protein [Dehalococcoidia bacterium]